jgi:hypothetical protein
MGFSYEFDLYPNPWSYHVKKGKSMTIEKKSDYTYGELAARIQWFYDMVRERVDHEQNENILEEHKTLLKEYVDAFEDILYP